MGDSRELIQRLIKVAKQILSFDMTEDEWKRYHKEHPNSERKNHHIIPNPKKKPSIKNKMEYARYLREKAENKKKIL